jgi:hypothetical protein
MISVTLRSRGTCTARSYLILSCAVQITPCSRDLTLPRVETALFNNRSDPVYGIIYTNFGLYTQRLISKYMFRERCLGSFPLAI